MTDLKVYVWRAALGLERNSTRAWKYEIAPVHRMRYPDGKRRPITAAGISCSVRSGSAPNQAAAIELGLAALAEINKEVTA